MLSKERPIVRYAVGLIGAIGLAQLITGSFFLLHDRVESRLHARVDGLHLQALGVLTRLQGAVGTARVQSRGQDTAAVAAHWAPVREDFERLRALHAAHPDARRDAALELFDMYFTRPGGSGDAASVRRQLQGMGAALDELARMHIEDADATLRAIDDLHRTFERATWIVLVPMLALCAVLIWRMIVQIRRTLLRQSEVERALQANRERAHRLEKVEALSQLIGGVAHDYNNLLTAISGNAQLLQARKDLPDDAKQSLAQIATAAHRATELTAQLRAFGRDRAGTPRRLEPFAWLDALATRYAQRYRDRRQIEIDIDRDLPQIWIDAAQFEAALLAILDNAVAATESGGQVTVTARTVHVAADHDHYDVLGDGAFLHVVIADDGVGMTPETLARAVDPFFTTRRRADGKGLGLSMALGVVQSAQGYLNLDSQPGQGTRVEIFLPAGAAQPDAGTVPPAPPGDETVVVLDDEPAIGELLRQGLTPLGYRVLTATDAPTALALCAADSPRADALISDLILPDANGLEVALEAQRARPSLPVLLMSGYAASALAESGATNLPFPLIDKPFDIDVVAWTLRNALDEAQPSTG